MVFKLPVFGTINRDATLALFCRVLGLLIDNGIPILDSLKITAGTMGGNMYGKFVESLGKQVEKGVPLSIPLASSRLFPPMVVQMVSAGEETGSLGSNMSKMADFFSALSQDATEFMKVGSEEWEKEMGISGVPVRWIHSIDEGSVSEGSIQDISEKNLDSSLFELPNGYEKDQSPWEKQSEGMNPYMQQ